MCTVEGGMRCRGTRCHTHAQLPMSCSCGSLQFDGGSLQLDGGTWQFVVRNGQSLTSGSRELLMLEASLKPPGVTCAWDQKQVFPHLITSPASPCTIACSVGACTGHISGVPVQHKQAQKHLPSAYTRTIALESPRVPQHWKVPGN